MREGDRRTAVSRLVVNTLPDGPLRFHPGVVRRVDEQID